ncbi:MAG: ferric siderophore ABC transporter substrate-binding protein [Myxococcota bacterium]
MNGSNEDSKFPRDSIASFVFDPKSAQSTTATRATSIAPGSIAALVFGHVSTSRSVRGILAGAFVAATLGSALAMSSPASGPGADAQSATPESEPMRIVQFVEPAPPEPETQVLPNTAKRRVTTRKRLQKADAPGAKPPPPAQAGKLVAVAPDDPLDFTDQSMVSADNAKFAGGVTAPSGTNQEAVRTSTVDPNAKPGGPQGEGSLARPVRLGSRSWNCPWPEEAEMLGITEQFVPIRVMTDPEGVALRVTVLADPGHGFGAAAAECARANKFRPALDDYGKPYAASSPVLRLRFTR